MRSRPSGAEIGIPIYWTIFQNFICSSVLLARPMAYPKVYTDREAVYRIKMLAFGKWALLKYVYIHRNRFSTADVVTSVM